MEKWWLQCREEQWHFVCRRKLFFVTQPHMSGCIGLITALTFCMVAIAGGIGCCCGCHKEQKQDHCDCRKTKWRRILNLVPDMFPKSSFMRTWPLDNISIQRIQMLLSHLKHITLFMTAARRNVLIGAKFTETQWSDTLISWSSFSHGAMPEVSTWRRNPPIFEKQVHFLNKPIEKKLQRQRVEGKMHFLYCSIKS